MFRFLFLIILSGFTIKTYAQCSVTVTSTNGYSVVVRIQPVSIVPSSTDCPWGYNYNVALNYSVSFIGASPPGSMYTLQGNMVCNGSQGLFFDLPNSPGNGSYTTGSNPFISNDGGTAYLYTTHPSCNAATISNLNCGGITIQINGLGINDQTINCNSAGPLPIELLYFTGKKTKAGVALQWKTETEKNNDFFTIEKSLNGFDWKVVSDVAGAGNSSRSLEYMFTDDDADLGVNYYRLKQTDYDKNFSYSPVIYVQNSSAEFVCTNVWPNPFTNNFNFEVVAPNDGRAKYNVLNELGDVIRSGYIDYHSGKNELSFSSEDYPTGVHVLEILFNEKNKIYRKIVKL